MALPEDPKTRKKRIARRWKIGLALLVGIVAAPFVATTIEGLVGLVVIWLISTIAVQFAPVISMKVAYWGCLPSLLKRQCAKTELGVSK